MRPESCWQYRPVRSYEGQTLSVENIDVLEFEVRAKNVLSYRLFDQGASASHQRHHHHHHDHHHHHHHQQQQQHPHPPPLPPSPPPPAPQPQPMTWGHGASESELIASDPFPFQMPTQFCLTSSCFQAVRHADQNRILWGISSQRLALPVPWGPWGAYREQ